MDPASQTVRLGSEKARRGVPFVAVVLGGLGLLVVGLGIVVARQSSMETVRLADGSTLTIEAVTFGKDALALGTGWQRFLYNVLPAQWKDRAGCRVVRGVTENCLHIWASGKDLSTRLAVVVDEHGNESAPCAPMLSLDSSAFNTSCYPRRSDRLSLRFYDSAPGARKVLGSVRIANPGETRHPVWAAPALPAVAQVGSLEATLLSLECDVALRGTALQPSPGEVLWRARVRLRQNGKPTSLFSPSLAELTDATGNLYSAQQETRPVRSGEWEVRFSAPRWGQEQALRLGLTCLAAEEGGFLPELALRVPGIPVPPAGGNVPVDRNVPLYGGEIHLRRMFAPGVLFTKAALAVPLADASRFMINAAVDDQGRRVSIGRPRTKVWAGEALGLQEITLPPGARSLTLAIHPTNSPTVEFLVPLPPR